VKTKLLYLLISLSYTIGLCFELHAARVGADSSSSSSISAPEAQIKRPYGVFKLQGGRPTMEDHTAISGGTDTSPPTFFGVFDGHLGNAAADFAAKNLFDNLLKNPLLQSNPAAAMIQAYEQTDDDIVKLKKADSSLDCSGTTAVSAFFSDGASGTVYIANTGDSRAVMSASGKVVLTTKCHKPNEEKERDRIENMGGSVYFDNTWRVARLAMSRALGDRNLKRVGLIATPDVYARTLTGEEDFIIIASDGLWDVFSSEEAVDFVFAEIKSRETPRTAPSAEAKASDEVSDSLTNKDATSIAQALAEKALKEGSAKNVYDNVSVIIVFLKHKWATLLASANTRIEAARAEAEAKVKAEAEAAAIRAAKVASAAAAAPKKASAPEMKSADIAAVLIAMRVPDTEAAGATEAKAAALRANEIEFARALATAIRAAAAEVTRPAKAAEAVRVETKTEAAGSNSKPGIAEASEANLASWFESGFVTMVDLEGKSFGSHGGQMLTLVAVTQNAIADAKRESKHLPFVAAFNDQCEKNLGRDGAATVMTRSFRKMPKDHGVAYTVVWSGSFNHIIIGEISDAGTFVEKYWWLKTTEGEPITLDYARALIDTLVHADIQRGNRWVPF
jgi:protein phosphatase 1L